MNVWLPGCIAFILSFICTPAARKLAMRWKFVDLPNDRKIHQQPLPLLGGAAIFMGILAAGILYFIKLKSLASPYFGVMVGAFLLFLIGVIDDFYKTRGKDFSVAVRFMIQIIAALMVPAFGGVIRVVSSPFDSPGFIVMPHLLAQIITVVWIVGVINVFNFLDGVDGLAAGIAAISGITLFFVALLKTDHASAIFALAVVGAALGFLRHNFHPAKIIMGDAGSTVLGYTLGSIAAIGSFKSATIVSIVVPVLALGVPIFDALRVVLIRAWRGQPVYKPDKSHVHHSLLRAGFSQRQTVALIYLLSACFSLASMIVLLLSAR
ncbi:undecaprenyl/decaprenyl-phosphate alpha-N-acetylglucosaminyl 1-phosphate transferase [Alicyclobacillus sp. TC]|uniref:UDP-GlcNAc:undecaprenyl-phosphate GlcNAc-1-phosphate transferase n=1 Tax=Alicyclobacillus tolerans TaxID=90970 RepID=A0A1M6V4S4_9BACL|nr:MULTISPECIES: MraY family glycosyltransferase [Alicyclobacillus]QRF24097.1 undecaprenyl/decaprenyl-phosphate alpha-N-acetylglucosaminyl 1-phosphate transferase [Alicyclobacillus sp. TC]SHK76497.1 UDP-GlcNAc:undecaprenyl-phosphate GlcNAc-1-phosphate transferase [Alicyclobacillus montanus]